MGCADPVLVNCVIVSNTAYEGGAGGIYSYLGSPSVRNCTIAYNSGGGVYVFDNIFIQNCILWGDADWEIYDEGYGGVAVEYSDIQGGWTNGTGIITNDPLFTTGWRLGPQSPCIDAGATNSVFADWEGDLRWDDPGHTNTVSHWDIGADEYRDSDGDGLEDWRETSTGIYVNSTNTGSSPTDADSDDDGIADGTEVSNRTDPNNSDTTPPNVTISFPTNNWQWTLIWIP